MKRRLDLRPALLLLAVGLAAQAQTVLIRAGRLVDPDKGTASTAQQILVENGVIKAVGANVSAPAGAQVVDLSDRTVLPGFMDAHTHLCMTFVTQGGKGLHELIQRSLAATVLETTTRRALIGVKNARDMLESGFAVQVHADDVVSRVRERAGCSLTKSTRGAKDQGPPGSL